MIIAALHFSENRRDSFHIHPGFLRRFTASRYDCKSVSASTAQVNNWF
jgi:hypothetical protein